MKLGVVAFSKPKFDNFLREHPELVEKYGMKNIYWIDLRSSSNTGIEVQKIEFIEELKEFSAEDYQKILSRVRTAR